ncbi:MAG: Two-component sensor histidine kinase [Acidimicrobiales bacterium]|nr:Two-component sensor histidine kinase [Acidimicrobiales bacterium]
MPLRGTRTSTRLRDRLDVLRSGFERRDDRVESVSVADAVERLERAISQHETVAGRVRATEDRLVRALDVIPQGVVLADEDGQVVFRNQAASGFFAARHSEALVEAAIRELIDQAVAGVPDTRTLDLYGPPRRALLLRAVPLETGREPRDDAGEPRSHGAFIIVDDVSERHRLDAVRRDFVANISHELKTPVGALGLLAETVATEDDIDVCRRLALRMQHEAFRVARTIDDLLELSRIEARELPGRDPVPVHLVFAEAVDRTRPAATLANVAIRVHEPPRQLTVIGDRRQLVSAAANLLDNAVKYSDEDSVVEVRARSDGQWVEIDVQDHGIGIPERDIERVFERFYRVDRARSRDTGGTGLGLAIVRHVVQNHEGDVQVVSLEGQGSTFTLRLPAGPGPIAVPRPQSEAG